MYVAVNGARLFFDVVGAQLDQGPSGSTERTALLVMHGGPGWEHSPFRRYFDRFADVVQVVYLDHRGNGRSRGGAGSDPETWTLDQWADDVAAFCEELGLDRPILYGQSFGGMVAQRHAARHPEQAGGYVFSSTAATFHLPEVLDDFERIGGRDVRDLAERFWTEMRDEDRDEYLRVCMPLYNYGTGDTTPTEGFIFSPDVMKHFLAAGGEIHRADLRAGLAGVRVPALVLTGDRDPVTSPARAREIHAALPAGAWFAEIAAAGHGAFRDRPEAVEPLLRDFIAEVLRTASSPAVLGVRGQTISSAS